MKANLVQGTFSIRGRDPDTDEATFKQVRGYTDPKQVLGIDRRYREWIITHLSSGTRLASARTLTMAAEMVKRVLAEVSVQDLRKEDPDQVIRTIPRETLAWMRSQRWASVLPGRTAEVLRGGSPREDAKALREARALLGSWDALQYTAAVTTLSEFAREMATTLLRVGQRLEQPTMSEQYDWAVRETPEVERVLRRAETLIKRIRQYAPDR